MGKEIVSGRSINDLDMRREKAHLGGYRSGGKFHLGDGEPTVASFVKPSTVQKAFDDASASIQQLLEKTIQARREGKVTENFANEVILLHRDFHGEKQKKLMRFIGITTPIPRNLSGSSYRYARERNDTVKMILQGLGLATKEQPFNSLVDAFSAAERKKAGF